MSETTKLGRVQFEETINKYFIPSQTRLIMMAYRFSKYGHRGQQRDDGMGYFDHPRQASLLLLEKGVFDHEIIISALLHDVMEDSFILTWEDLEFIFGSRVCTIVKLVTKERGMPKDQYFPRLLTGLPEAWIVKLADRLHNLNTLGGCSRAKQLKQIQETREKILPLCQKLAQEKPYLELANWFTEQIEMKCQEYD